MTVFSPLFGGTVEIAPRRPNRSFSFVLGALREINRTDATEEHNRAEREIDEMALRPHPYEFFLYYDA